MTGLDHRLLYNRWHRGVRGDELGAKAPKKILTEYKGEKRTLYGIAKMTDTSYPVILHRYNQGYRGDELGRDQSQNATHNLLLIDYKGKKRTLSEISKMTGLDHRLLYNRWHRGVRGDELGAKLQKAPKKILTEYKGEKRTLYRIAKMTGTSYPVILHRYNHGYRGDDLGRDQSRSAARNLHLIDYKGKQMTLYEIAKDAEVTYQTVWNRYNQGFRGTALTAKRYDLDKDDTPTEKK
ncbi:hypothetical protein DXH47_04465 [Levilactobacillus suantsaii]|uniref:Uncharacterized protein n=2 Tax=Levilactobacillus suantsaii TaxID=2292255 RepID=A0A4Q0VJZ3_9LACO|nr:hypothetical protein DXH47_04465 [Levilactobacillus suantsaii]